MGADSDDDATEILGRDTHSAPADNTVGVATQVEHSGTSVRGRAGVVEVVAPHADSSAYRSRSWPRWLAVAVLLMVTALGFYAYSKRIPVPGIGSPAVIDAYPEALALVESAVTAGNVDTLASELWALDRRQGGDSAVQLLLEDASHYHRMLYELERQPLRLARQRLSSSFSTEVFEAAALREIDPVLGSPDRVLELTGAADHWREGRLVEAINLARGLAVEEGDKAALAMLKRYSSVLEDYDALEQLKEGGAYPQALLLFYLGLDPLEDHFFWERLAVDFEFAQERLPPDTAPRLEEIARLWQSYHSSGGIDGELRRQLKPHTGFQLRAAELGEAHSLVNALFADLGGLVQLPPPGELNFPRQVRAELLYQRERLAALLVFNAEAILEQRLMQLPGADALPGE